MKILSKILLWLFGCFALFDILTTSLVFVFKDGSGLETNPLHVLGGGLWMIILLNIFYLLFLWWQMTKYESNGNQMFFYTTVITYLTLVRTLAIYNAITWLFAPQEQIIETVSSLTPETKMTYYFLLMLTKFVFPVLLSMITFWLFRVGFNVTPKTR